MRRTKRTDAHTDAHTDARTDAQTDARNREAAMNALLAQGGSREYWEQVVEDRKEHESAHPDDVGHPAETSGR